MGFSPLEIVLMVAVATMFFILVKVLRESVTAIVNNTNAINSLRDTIRIKKLKG